MLIRGQRHEKAEPPRIPGLREDLPEWNDDESRAFQEAMAALTSLPDDAPAYLLDEKGNKIPGQ